MTHNADDVVASASSFQPMPDPYEEAQRLDEARRALKIQDQITMLAERILRKLLGRRDDGYGENYVDLAAGIFDCRVTLTDEEKTYLRALRIDGDVSS